MKGEKSQFDVARDGETVFSKQDAGRWPAPGEVLGLLAQEEARAEPLVGQLQNELVRTRAVC